MKKYSSKTNKSRQSNISFDQDDDQDQLETGNTVDEASALFSDNSQGLMDSSRSDVDQKPCNYSKHSPEFSQDQTKEELLSDLPVIHSVDMRELSESIAENQSLNQQLYDLKRRASIDTATLEQLKEKKMVICKGRKNRKYKVKKVTQDKEDIDAILRLTLHQKDQQQMAIDDIMDSQKEAQNVNKFALQWVVEKPQKIIKAVSDEDSQNFIGNNRIDSKQDQIYPTLLKQQKESVIAIASFNEDTNANTASINSSSNHSKDNYSLLNSEVSKRPRSDTKSIDIVDKEYTESSKHLPSLSNNHNEKSTCFNSGSTKSGSAKSSASSKETDQIENKNQSPIITPRRLTPIFVDVKNKCPIIHLNLDEKITIKHEKPIESIITTRSEINDRCNNINSNKPIENKNIPFTKYQKLYKEYKDRTLLEYLNDNKTDNELNSNDKNNKKSIVNDNKMQPEQCELDNNFKEKYLYKKLSNQLSPQRPIECKSFDIAFDAKEVYNFLNSSCLIHSSIIRHHNSKDNKENNITNSINTSGKTSIENPSLNKVWRKSCTKHIASKNTVNEYSSRQSNQKEQNGIGIPQSRWLNQMNQNSDASTLKRSEDKFPKLGSIKHPSINGNKFK